MKRLWELAVLAAVGLLAIACGGGEKKVRFAVMPKQLDNPVFNYPKVGALAKARELGVEVLWSAPQSNDEAKQAELLRGFIAGKVDGIAVSCTNPDMLSGPINEAIGAGIPVTTWDSDSPRSKRVCFYGMDDYNAGQIIARELGEMIGGRGKVAVLSGVPDATNLVARVRGVHEYMKKHFPEVQLLDTIYCNDDVDKAVSVVASTMSTHPDLAGWAMVGGWPLFSKAGLDAVDPAKTKVVAVDPLPEVWPWIEKGKLHVAVGQKVFDWGAKSVELLWRLHRGEKIAEARDGWFVDSGVDLVVLDPKAFAHPERYTALEVYKKQFQARLASAR